MNKYLFFATIVLSAFILARCNQSDLETTTSGKTKVVMTKEMQNQLTPDAILEDLLKGNERYMSGKMTNRDIPAQIIATTEGQFPKAIILACVDSRVPVEYIFDQGVGDIFVARVAGNIEDEQLIGSIEYGLAIAGSKVLMVLGHQNCGAVKSAVGKVDVGSINVSTLLNEIEPAIERTEGDRNAKDHEYCDKVAKNNVVQTMEDIKKRSPIISTLEKEGKVKIVGAFYSLANGKVMIIPE